MAQRLLSNVFSGFLAGAAGGLAGEQAGKERALQLAEMKRRQAMQDEDQAMQRFSFGANLERQGIEDQLSGDEFALRNSDPNAEGYGDLFDKIQAHRQQVLGQRQFTPQNFPFIRNGMQPLPNAVPGQGQPQPIPNATPGMGQVQPLGQPLRPVRTDPKQEKAKVALLDQWKTLYNDVVQVDRDTAMELGNLIRRVNAGEFKDLAEAEALAAPIIAKSKSKFQLQQTQRDEEKAADRTFRQKQLDLTEAERLRVDADRQAKEADRDATRAAKAENDARNYDLKLNDDLLAAKKTGNAAAVRRILDQRSLHAKQFPKIVSVDPEYADEPMEVKRTKTIFNGIPNANTEEEVWEPETPEEVQFRKSRYLASLLEDPKAKEKADKDALKDLWGVFRSGRWTALSPESRASIIDQIGEYGSKLYGQADLFPKGLKDVMFTPAEIESKRRWEITNARANEDQRMQRESHKKSIELADKNLVLAEQKAKGLYKPGGEDINSTYFAMQAAISDLRDARNGLAEASKTPEAGWGGKQTARWQQEVEEARSALNAVIANPQQAVQQIQQKQGMKAPVQKRPAQAAPPTAGKLPYKFGSKTLYLTPGEAKQLHLPGA